MKNLPLSNNSSQKEEQRLKKVQEYLDKRGNKNDESNLESWSRIMSYNFFMLAKELGYVVTKQSNLITAFDLLDNLESYSEYMSELDKENK